MNDNSIIRAVIDKPLRLFRKTFDRFIRIRGNPKDISLGFAMGIFIGMSPTMGIQIWIAVFMAALLKWNKIAAAAGVWITNPLTAPGIYGTTYLVGAKFLGFEKLQPFSLELTISNLQQLIAKAPKVFGAMIVGGVALGIPLAVIGFYASFYLVRKYQPRVKNRVAQQKKRLADTKVKVKSRLHRKQKQQNRR